MPIAVARPGKAGVMRQLWPTPADSVDLDALYGTEPDRTPPHGRPWVIVSMIASADGATAVNGLSGGLGGAGDKAVFATMRRLAGVVIAGSATVRDEGYRPPARTSLRIGVVTARGSIDPTSALFTSGAGFAITTLEAEVHGVEAIRAGTGSVDLAGALAQLDARVVVCEGGPRLNASMLAAGLVDELCLTVAPMLVAGDSTRVAAGRELATPVSLGLRHVLADDEGYLYLRYARTGSTI